MRRAAAAVLTAAVFAVPAAHAAAASPQQVSIQFQSYAPTPIDVLPGETVDWGNASERRHTVTADDGSFDSGDLFGGDHFSHRFDAVGAYTYHCTVHSGMTGEVDVRRVTLDPLPPAAVPAGQPVHFGGRTADPGPVTLEQSTPSGFRAVARVLPSSDGSWSADVTPATTAAYRASSVLGTSETRRLLVTDRRVVVSAQRGRVHVTVTPADPGARVRLQEHLRERFGWWPAAVRRLDYLSRTTFTLHRRVRVRVVLVDRDGWTPVATSRVLKLNARRAR